MPNLHDLEYVTTLYLDSKDRQADQNVNNITLNFQNKLFDVDYIAVYRFQLMNQVYPINSTNNILYYSYGATSYSLTVPAGNYTALTLASYLQTQIRTDTGDASLAVTFDTTKSKFYFQSSGVPVWQFLSNPITYPNNIGRSLGFIIDNNDTNNYTYPSVANANVYSNYPVNITSSQYLDFRSNFLCQYMRPSGSSNAQSGSILFRAYTNVFPFGTVQQVMLRNLMLMEWMPTHALGDQIDISVVDQFGIPALLQNSEYNFQIACFRKKRY